MSEISKMGDERSDWLESLSAAQEAVVNTVIDGPQPARVIVSATVGAGKTHLAAAIARRVLALEPMSRLLFLVPSRVIAGAFEDRLDVPRADLFTRAAARAAVAGREEPFPRPISVFVTFKEARSREVQTALAAVMWDLIVVDDAQEAGPGLRRILGRLTSVHTRLLMLGDESQARSFAASWPTATMVDLARAEVGQRVSGANARAALRPTSLSLVPYRRRRDERDAVERTVRAATRLRPWAGRAQISRVRRASESSIYALQQEALVVLETSRLRRNVLAHRATGGDEARHDEFARLSLELRELERVVDVLDELSPDTKAQAFLALARKLLQTSSANQRGICVVVALATTAMYLRSALSDSGMRSTVVASEKRIPASIVSDVSEGPGFLLIVDDALPGYDLREFRIAVHYDLPEDSHGWDERFARIGASVGRSRARSFVILDEERMTSSPDSGRAD